LADFVAKVFWSGERKFLGPLKRFTRGDVYGRRSKNRGAIALAEVQADLNLARFLHYRFGPLHRKSLLGLHAA
jgi:hypothetical protein